MENNYMKILDETEKNYSKHLRKGFVIFRNFGGKRNLSKVDNYIFKHGDLMGEDSQLDFPFTLDKDTSMAVINLKGEVINYVVEPEQAKSYHVTYQTRDYRFIIIISYDEQKEEVFSRAILSKEVIDYFKVNFMNKNSVIDEAVNALGKMIHLISNDKIRLVHEWPGGFAVRGTTTMRRVKASLVSTRYKNMIITCDAYPYFYDVDFVKIDNEMRGV